MRRGGRSAAGVGLLLADAAAAAAAARGHDVGSAAEAAVARPRDVRCRLPKRRLFLEFVVIFRVRILGLLGGRDRLWEVRNRERFRETLRWFNNYY